MLTPIDVQPTVWRPSRASRPTECVVVDGCEVVVGTPSCMPRHSADEHHSGAQVDTPGARLKGLLRALMMGASVIGAATVAFVHGTPAKDAGSQLAQWVDPQRLAAMVPKHADDIPQTRFLVEPRHPPARPKELALRLDLPPSFKARRPD